MRKNWMGKCLAEMSNAADGVKRGAHNVKQDGQIANLESHITELTMEIGNLTLLQLDAGLGANEPIMERFEEICAAREAIDTAEDAKQIRWITCPHCGRKTTARMRYCGCCGEPITTQREALPAAENQGA